MNIPNSLKAAVSFLAALLWSIAAFGADDKQISDKAREIEDNLIAPCCWSQPVSQHYSEVAEQIRKEVREMVAAGKSRDEIMNFYVAKYGERILATPRPKGFNTLVYILPWAALILGAWLLIILLKKLRTRRPLAPAPEAPLPAERYTAIVDREIQELDK
jgi:cytochrome c-type biogenesis protein CcmH